MFVTDSYNLVMRSLPFAGSAVVFFSIAFLTWAQTPKKMRDALGFTLVWFITPWGVYALLVSGGWGLSWDPPRYLFTITRTWIGFTVLVALWALIPRVIDVIRFRLRHHCWPRDCQEAK